MISFTKIVEQYNNAKASGITFTEIEVSMEEMKSLVSDVEALAKFDKKGKVDSVNVVMDFRIAPEECVKIRVK